MKGFFSSQEVKSKTRPDGRTYSCASCGLYKNVQSPKMKPFGNFKKGILNIGEAPGEAEDSKGKQWQGRTGKLLKRTYEKHGIDLFEDCLNINAVNCKPPNNRAPSNYEIDCCRNVIVNRVINEYEPEIIILLGGSAIQSFLSNRFKKELGGITKWRGWTIPDQDYKAWVCPTFHPSFVERMEQKEVNKIWEDDLQNAFQKVDEPFPVYKKPNLHYIENLSVLYDIKSDLIAFDYETTGLKPHSKGHRIVCCSIAYDEDNAYIFPMPKTKKGMKPLIWLLENPDIKKIASNMKYEHQWSFYRLLGCDVNNWYWDTMLAAHVLDQRTGISSIKFQSYVQLGIIDYSSEIEPYLIAEDSNSLNRIFDIWESDPQKLLTYCGYDSIYEYRVAVMQMKQIELESLPF